ncbi:S-layer homology domain-containing protein [Bacillus sp. MCCB 382]|uniref:S-layer homology domain-containing protein n=1 Tax=Bacillus sp. MCCB 382 TaxID=2860197 RepID=UPI001C57E27E|nr:S-layer homology domain-containing protein [Bacillus sp. MCCB 382]
MNKLSRNKKFIASTVSASIVAATVAAPVASAFSDVKEDTYYYEAVKFLTEQGIVDGFPDNTFRPDQQVTRGQMAKFIAKALDLDTTSVKGSHFTDIEGNRFHTYISVLSEKGIIEGFEDRTFRPNEPVKRSEAAKFLAKAYDLDENFNVSFDDVKKGKWYAGYIGALVEHGITLGKTSTLFDPDGTVKRKEMAAFIYRSGSVKPVTAMNIDSISGTYITVEGEKYSVPSSLQGLFSEQNAKALQNAKIRFSLGEDNNIEEITYLELTSVSKEAISLDGRNAIINGNLKVQSPSITLSNLTVNKNLMFIGTPSGSTSLKNVVVKGETSYKDGTSVSVKGASEQYPTVNVNDSNLETVTLDYKNMNFISKGTTVMNQVNIQKNAKIDSAIGLANLQLGKSVTELTVNGMIKELTTSGEDLTILGQANIMKLVVSGDEAVNLNTTGTIDLIEVKNKKSKLVLSMNVIIKDINLPAASKIEEIIYNYNQVKSEIKKINGISNPDAYSHSGGGGYTPPPTPSKSSSLQLEDVMVTNKQGDTPDEITIGGLATGDVVKVYGSATGTEALTTVTATGQELTINTLPLSSTGGYVWVSIKRSGKTESDRIMKRYYDEQITVLNKAGIYGPADSESRETINGDVVIDADDVILNNTIITGDLIISESVGEGEATLNNVEVQGSTIIKGGGLNSIHFNDSVLATVIINKNNGAIRVVAEGSTRIVEVQLESTAKLEENLDEGSEGFTDVTVSEELQSSNTNLQVELIGSFETINSRASQVQIHLAEDTDIETLVLNAIANVIGEGRITSLEVNSSGSTISQTPQNVVLNISPVTNEQNTVTVGGEEVTESSSSARSTEINDFTLTQSFISLNLGEYVSDLSIEDFVISGSLNGIELAQDDIDGMNFVYHPNLGVLTYSPLTTLEGTLSVTVSPLSAPEEGVEDTRKLRGTPVTKVIDLGTGASGRLTDIFGASAANATLKFRPSGADPESEPVKTVTTDKNGFYSVSLPPGTYIGEVSGNGYVTTSILVTITDDLFQEGQDETVIRQAGTNATKIMLSWNEQERDVDSHLIGPTINGEEFHTFYSNRTYEDGEMIYVDLDWDDVDFFGPETTTIRKWTDGRYVFYVHNFSGEKELSESGSVVKVFNGTDGQASKTYRVPTETGDKEYWAVFELLVSDNGTSFQYNEINEMVMDDFVLSSPKESLTSLISEVGYFLTSAGDFFTEGDLLELNSLRTQARATIENTNATTKELIAAYEKLNEERYSLNVPPTIEFVEGISDININTNEELPIFSEADVIVNDPDSQSGWSLNISMKDSEGNEVAYSGSAEVGVYEVTYTVTDAKGASAQITRTVTVTEQPDQQVQPELIQHTVTLGSDLDQSTIIQFDETFTPPSLEATDGTYGFKLVYDSNQSQELQTWYEENKKPDGDEPEWYTYLFNTVPTGEDDTEVNAMFNLVKNSEGWKIQDGTQAASNQLEDASAGMIIPNDFPSGTYTFAGSIDGKEVMVEITINTSEEIATSDSLDMGTHFAVENGIVRFI